MKYPVLVVSEHRGIELTRYSDHIPRVGEFVAVQTAHRQCIYIQVTAVYHETGGAVVVEAALIPERYDVFLSAVAEPYRTLTNKHSRMYL